VPGPGSAGVGLALTAKLLVVSGLHLSDAMVSVVWGAAGEMWSASGSALAVGCPVKASDFPSASVVAAAAEGCSVAAANLLATSSGTVESASQHCNSEACLVAKQLLESYFLCASIMPFMADKHMRANERESRAHPRGTDCLEEVIWVCMM
jgi:hypothetical protein